MVKLIRVKDLNNFELSDMLAGQILELLIDTKNNHIYHVSPPVGHSKAAAFHLGIDQSQINESNASHLVSALIEIKNRVVTKINVGVSSLELGHKIRHTHAQLKKAAEILEAVIRLSRQLKEIKIAENVEWKMAA